MLPVAAAALVNFHRGWGWVLVGWTGLVLSASPKTAARLVYRSAALVAFLT